MATPLRESRRLPSIMAVLASLLVVAALASLVGRREATSLSPAEAGAFLSGGTLGILYDGSRHGGDRMRLDRDRAKARATFRRLAASHTGPLAGWAAGQRLDRQMRARTIFYPFAGPDAAFPLALFPWAREYILVGLEPVFDGAGHDPLRVAGARSLVGSVPGALADFSGNGFFITRNMNTAHEQGRFPGVLAIVLATVAAEHGDVDAVEYVCEAGTGGLEVVDRRALVRVGRRPCGVRVRFHDRAGDAKTILYLRLSLDDPSLSAHPVLAALLQGRDYAVFCKAGQYLMHGTRGGSFKIVTRLALSGSAILQDDTCLPLRAFDRATWNLSFFGHYKPVRMFAHMLQPELQTIYADRTAIGDVPQVAGYGGRTNLMLGIRR